MTFERRMWRETILFQLFQVCTNAGGGSFTSPGNLPMGCFGPISRPVSIVSEDGDDRWTENDEQSLGVSRGAERAAALEQPTPPKKPADFRRAATPYAFGCDDIATRISGRKYQPIVFHLSSAARKPRRPFGRTRRIP
jgi:hypothetical protein